jgi:hypothetical protein
MLVLVVLVVNMRVCVLHRPVHVLMLVMLCQMKPYAHAHQQTRCKELDGQGLPQKH